MRRVVRDELLVAVGRALGVSAAEELYLALASEPVDAHGARVDWEVIGAQIRVGGPPRWAASLHR